MKQINHFKLKLLKLQFKLKFTCTSVRPVVALTSGGKGDVEAGAEGSNFSEDPA